ncbi:hypothetical protein SAMN05192529_11391 [Arachidicoccus rhizosphaerae]|uniref:Uncharacterized protein n=1 Tax=Arachidicoccus rhizosphaerae TaxID=551991 RepID=A0A1H4A6P1_9BACT|nr:hypothetical protein SAMN05192529_11391 [Arachidicoccus rhizosphaerae]
MVTLKEFLAFPAFVPNFVKDTLFKFIIVEKRSKIVVCFCLLIAVALIMRLIPMPAGIYGVTPMYAMAIFGGVVFKKDKKYAFLLPLLSFFICDVVVEVLFKLGAWSTPGFYEGQLINYILFALLTVIGFGVKKPGIVSVGIASLVAPTIFYILSNLSVWAFAGFYPMTADGLKGCYIAGFPFYFPYSLLSTLVFSAILFGVYSLYKAKSKALHLSHS